MLGLSSAGVGSGSEGPDSETFSRKYEKGMATHAPAFFRRVSGVGPTQEAPMCKFEATELDAPLFCSIIHSHDQDFSVSHHSSCKTSHMPSRDIDIPRCGVPDIMRVEDTANGMCLL